MSRQQRRSRQRRTSSASTSQSQRSWLLWTGAGVALVVVVVVAVLFAAGVFGGGSSKGLSQAQVDDLVSDSHLIAGNPSAPVTMVEFADFQCPYCQQFWVSILPYIKSQFIDTGQANLYFHHMAFIGPESELAGEAAECAAEQGKFEEYYNILYQLQGRENEGYITQDRLESFAATAGLDVTAFSSCLSSGKYLSKVRSDTASSVNAGVNSTPTLLVNGVFVENPLDVNQVRQAIQSAIDKAS